MTVNEEVSGALRAGFVVAVEREYGRRYATVARRWLGLWSAAGATPTIISQAVAEARSDNQSRHASPDLAVITQKVQRLCGVQSGVR